MASVSVNIKNYRTEIPGKIIGHAWEFPQVNSVHASGRKSEWKIVVRLFDSSKQHMTELTDEASLPILDEYFNRRPIVNISAWTKVYSRLHDGKVRDSVPTITYSGKNIGKANETNVFTQALRDALGIYNKQVKKAVSEVKTTGVTRYPPMLATLLKDKDALDFRCLHIQRKYDGVRAVATLDLFIDELGKPVSSYTIFKN